MTDSNNKAAWIVGGLGVIGVVIAAVIAGVFTLTNTYIQLPSENRHPSPISPANTNEQKPTPTPTISPSITVQVRLIAAGGSGCSFYDGVHMLLKTQGREYKAVTDSQGIATFTNVLCGGLAEVTAPDIRLMFRNDEVFRIAHTLNCSSGSIYLGAFDNLNGMIMPDEDAIKCKR
jgi:hypothetical protein